MARVPEPAWRINLAPGADTAVPLLGADLQQQPIHYDYRYRTEHEVYPGLAVHGPKIATRLVGLVVQARHEPMPLAAPVFDHMASNTAGRLEAAAGDASGWHDGPVRGCIVDATTSTKGEATMQEWPGWRSLLFVPADNQHLLAKAGERGADACILDLEDAVAPCDRPAARDRLPDAVTRLGADGPAVLVRVNGGMRDQVRDMEACVRTHLTAVLVPKVETPHALVETDKLLAELEGERGLPPGQIRLVAMIESARGLLAAPEIAAASPRLAALALGPEDLALDLDGRPDTELLTEPARRMVWAARAAAIQALGFPGSIGNYSDLPLLRQQLVAARTLGFAGALCIHPAQIDPIHAAFAVSDEEYDWALRVVDAAGGPEGVSSVDGQMIDRPVLLRARALLARAQRASPGS